MTTLTITEVHFDPHSRINNGRWTRPERSKVYVWPEGEAIWDNFISRFSRPSKAYRTILADAIAQAGLDSTDGIKFVWSQKAGCGCGCSPGFIASMPLTKHGYRGNVSVTLQGPTIDPAKANVRRARAAAIGVEL